MPDTLSSTLTTIALSWGVPWLLVFWYACRVRHPARTRVRAFLMALAVVAVVPPPAILAGLYDYVVNNEGAPFLVVPAVLALSFVLCVLIRGWLGRPPPCGARQSCRGRPRPSRPRHGMPSRPMPPNRPTNAASPPGQRTAPAPNRPPCRREPGVSPGGLERSIHVSS